MVWCDVIFPSQIAQRVIVQGPNGQIQITVLNSQPRIEFRKNPTSTNPNAFIEYSGSSDRLTIETDYVRSEYGSIASPQPAWYVRVQQARGIMLDDNTDTLRRTDGSVLNTNPQTWELITSFSNGWTALVAAPPEYYIGPDGFVHLYGRAIPGTTADGTVMMNIPAEARPARNYFVPCMQDNAPYVRPGIEVQSGGDVRIFNWSAGNVTLDAVSFCIFLA